VTVARLSRLEIEDFALIARASLEFSDGFTVCSGETGSGKTMLLGALAFVLGERSSADVVRAGATRARVTLEVEPDDALRARLAAEGFDGDEGEAALFSREMLAGGKSSARINGRLATSAQLRAFGERLVDAIGQHEAQRLLAPAYQCDVLDAFAGAAALEARRTVATAYERVGNLERGLRELTDDVGRALAELEFARFALREIEEAAPAFGEDEALRERRDYLVNVERIRGVLGSAHEALTAGESSAVDALGAAAAALASVARLAPSLAALAERLAGLQSDAVDAAVTLARELEATDFDAAELEAATARLDLLERLKRKYGGSLQAVNDARTRFAETIAREDSREEREAELRAGLREAHATLSQAAGELGAQRRSAARALEKRVAAELAGLAMPAATFAVTLEPLAEPGPGGGESVAFALSPNPGEPARSLARAASGGELSRVLLALVVVLAGRRERTALIFDEIDAGIGGATATAVGVRLGALAERTQVLCVTHLAQIASWADRHYVLRKRERRGTTLVELVALDEREAVLEEIARMLSGSPAGVALEHAEALVREARGRKTRPRAVAGA
jgi:DNA repair protein RecN (Recombination protein N)